MYVFLRGLPMCGSNLWGAQAGCHCRPSRLVPVWHWTSGWNLASPLELWLLYCSLHLSATSGKGHASESPLLNMICSLLSFRKLMHFIKSCRYAYKHGVTHLFRDAQKSCLKMITNTVTLTSNNRKWKTKQRTCEMT